MDPIPASCWASAPAQGLQPPALTEFEKTAHSKVPTLGYGLACAIGNVLLAICGTVLVLFGRY